MKADKLRGLRKALLYSYQAATLVTSDNKEFRCLINPDNLKPDYDNRILSIPFEDICLNKKRKRGEKTSEGLMSAASRPREEGTDPFELPEEEIQDGIKPGDIFRWKENGTYWLIFLRDIEETAYFRAEIKRCDSTVIINGKEYKAYTRGPVETVIKWLQKSSISWNSLNYSLQMIIPKNEETLKYLHRHARIRVDGKIWVVKAVDEYNANNTIQVALGEDYENEFEENSISEPQEEIVEDLNVFDNEYFTGPSVVDGYGRAVYTLKQLDANYEYRVSDRKIVRLEKVNSELIATIMVGKKSSFSIDIYDLDTEEVLETFEIQINSV